MKVLGKWLSSILHLYSHLWVVSGLVMLTFLTNGCSSIAGGVATTAIRAATGQGSGGLEVSPTVQIGRENVSRNAQGALSQTTEVARDQIINGPDFIMLMGILFAIGLTATMLGYFASDNIQRWINSRKK